MMSSGNVDHRSNERIRLPIFSRCASSLLRKSNLDVQILIAEIAEMSPVLCSGPAQRPQSRFLEPKSRSSEKRANGQRCFNSLQSQCSERRYDRQNWLDLHQTMETRLDQPTWTKFEQLASKRKNKID